MHFKKEDFASMIYNVMALDPKKAVTTIFSDLAIFDDFRSEVEIQTGLNFNTFMRYVILMYEKNTPLSLIDRYQLRKSKAAELAGFKLITVRKEETFEPNVIKLITTPCEYPIVNRLIVLFLRFHRSQKFSALSMYNEMFYGTIEKIYNGEYDKQKKELVDALKDDIESAYFDLFQSTTIDETIKEEAEIVMLEESIGLNPEDMATRLQDGKYFCLLKNGSKHK